MVYTGFKLLEPAEFRKLLKISRVDACISLTMAFVMVIVDLPVGVLAGFALSARDLAQISAQTYSHFSSEFLIPAR